jgi:hypothetical protein
VVEEDVVVVLDVLVVVVVVLLVDVVVVVDVLLVVDVDVYCIAVVVLVVLGIGPGVPNITSKSSQHPFIPE